MALTEKQIEEINDRHDKIVEEAITELTVQAEEHEIELPGEFYTAYEKGLHKALAALED